MKEYIEREAAMQVLCDACGNAACPKGLIPRCSYYEKMQSIPAADVRPVARGEWLPFGKRGIYGMMYACSSCRAKYDGKTNFCPNCGADMREES